MDRRTCGGIAAVMVLLVLLGVVSSRSLPDGRAQRPVIVLLNDWASQQVFAHIVGRLIERGGQPVTYQYSDAELQFDALALGDAHVQVAVWHNRMAEPFEHALDRGVVNAGQHALHFRDGWWVSDATLAVCPQAATWSGLIACAGRTEALRTADASVQATESLSIPTGLPGYFHAPPEAFDRSYADVVDKLRMPFTVHPAADLAALGETWRRFDNQSALTPDVPIEVVYNWSPNTLEGGPVNGRFVDFPEPELACFLDPDWGPNPDVTGDCGDPLPFPVSKAAWAGLIDAFPDTWQLLQAVSFDAIDYRQVVAWMARPGAEPARVAQRWIEANVERVSEWQEAL